MWGWQTEKSSLLQIVHSSTFFVENFHGLSTILALLACEICISWVENKFHLLLFPTWDMFTFNFTAFDAAFIFSCWGISITCRVGMSSLKIRDPSRNWPLWNVFSIPISFRLSLVRLSLFYSPLSLVVYPLLHLYLLKMLILASFSRARETSSSTLSWKTESFWIQGKNLLPF